MDKKNLAWEWYWKNLSREAPVTMLTDPPRYPPDPIDAFIAGYEAGHSAGFEGCLKAKELLSEHLEEKLVEEMFVNVEPLLKGK